MMRYIYSHSTDPYWNLALEQHVFDRLDRAYDYFMLWQNSNAIIVGKYQNTAAEINPDYVRENGIAVVRRLSGGGAVYHDLGNLNFTFIADSQEAGFDFSTFCAPVMRALATLGVRAELSGRNDMTIDGKKFSGNSMYVKNGRVMHHGTIMYDSDLRVLSSALNVPKDKIESKGVQSVRGRVTNIKPYMKEDIPIDRFIHALRGFMFQEYAMEEYRLTEDDYTSVRKLRDEVYSTWEWNFGASPQYSVHKKRRVEGCGKIEIFMEVKQGVIQDIRFYGDFFGNGDHSDFNALLKGRQLSEKDLRSALYGIPVGDYFRNLSCDDLISILLS